MLIVREVEQELNQWALENQVEGVGFNFRSMEFSGFPFTLSLKLEGVTIGINSSKLDNWSWNIHEIKAWVSPWLPDHVWFDASGKQELVINSNEAEKRYTITSAEIGGDINFISDTQGFMNIRAGDLSIKRMGFNPSRIQRSDINLDWHFHRELDGATEPIKFRFQLKDMRLPDIWAQPFGTKLEIIELAGKLSGSLKQGPFMSTLEGWRDAGGTIEISDFVARYGPLDLKIKGTLALDKRMQPIGALVARAEGYMDLVDALVDTDLIRPGAGTAIKLALSIIAKRSENRPDYVKIPLTIQNQRLSVSNFSLLRLPTLNWHPLQ